MVNKATTHELSKLIHAMQAERQEHVDAIAAIDQTFEQFGITPETKAPRRGPGRPRKNASSKETKPKGTRRGGRRRRFSRTGEESVLAFVKEHGNPTTKEVNEHWQNEKRGGKADNTLSKLAKEKKLKRIQIEGERGSRYQPA